MANRVVVVGGGVIGLCVAHYCARRGFEVTLVERNGESRDGCSYGNAGMVVPSHIVPLAAPGMVALGLKWMWNPASPFYVKPRLSRDLLDWGLKFWRAATPDHVRRAAPLLCALSIASRDEFDQLAALPGSDFGLEKRGLLMLCKTVHGLAEEVKVAELARSLGLSADVLDAGELAALEPGVRADVAGAVYYRADAHLLPDRFMAAMQAELAAAGVRCLWNTEVTGWRIGPDRRIHAVRTNEGREIEGDEYVLCGGSWSPLLARELGLRIPIEAGKGYSLTLAKPRQSPRICAILTEARIAVTPMHGTLRFAGTMEIAGRDETINPVRVRGIIDAIPRYFPQFAAEDFSGVAPWCGLRPCSPDGLPYIGRTARAANLSIAAGHAMMGLNLAPITGKLVAGVLVGEAPPFDLALLSPDRYDRA